MLASQQTYFQTSLPNAADDMARVASQDERDARPEREYLVDAELLAVWIRDLDSQIAGWERDKAHCQEHIDKLCRDRDALQANMDRLNRRKPANDGGASL